MVSDGAPRVTIVVPTYNERANANRLLRAFKDLQERWDQPFDVIIVDDDSPDGTADAFTEISNRIGLPVRVMRRVQGRSLGKSVADGLRCSRADIVCVMDADLSHPPSLLPILFERLNGFDGVVASRYVAGASIVGWPISRWIISRVATGLARPFLRAHCSDPLSGYFIFHRDSLRDVELSGVGNKPLLEILAKKSLAVLDVPYEFRNREKGKSKLGMRGIVEYLQLLMSLWLSREKDAGEGLTSKVPSPPIAQDTEGMENSVG